MEFANLPFPFILFYHCTIWQQSQFVKIIICVAFIVRILSNWLHICYKKQQFHKSINVDEHYPLLSRQKLNGVGAGIESRAAFLLKRLQGALL